LACSPSFSEYRFGTELSGGRLRTVALTEGRWDLDSLAAAIAPETKVIFVCNPNNPTGGWVTQAEFDLFLAQIPPSILVIVDEAYAEFAQDPRFPKLIPLAVTRPNLLVMRTFSKVYGLAGLRIGCVIGEANTLRLLAKVKQPFNVGLVAQAAAVAALADCDYVAQTLANNRVGMARLTQQLDQWGWEYLPSAANFMALRPFGGRAQEMVLFCEQHGLILRPLRSFGMPEWLRITIGLPAEMDLFLSLAQRWHDAEHARLAHTAP